jgi:hypothetical protein
MYSTRANTVVVSCHITAALVTASAVPFVRVDTTNVTKISAERRMICKKMQKGRKKYFSLWQVRKVGLKRVSSTEKWSHDCMVELLYLYCTDLIPQKAAGHFEEPKGYRWLAGKAEVYHVNVNQEVLTSFENNRHHLPLSSRDPGKEEKII